MNEVDVERMRLNSRVAVTTFALMIGVVIGLGILYEILHEYWEDVHIIFISALGVVIAKRFDKNIRNWFEKRLMNSKERSHTT